MRIVFNTGAESPKSEAATEPGSDVWWRWAAAGALTVFAFALFGASSTPAQDVTPQHGCMSQLSTIKGTDGPEVIQGTSGDDVIVALGGDDTIRGGGGKDYVCAGDGNDHVTVGRSGDPSALRVESGSGDDYVTVKSASQITGWKHSVYLGEGDDYYFGSPAGDVVEGGGGDDRLKGEQGDDQLSGGSGDDEGWCLTGDDHFSGGSGTDRGFGCQGELGVEY